MFFDPGPDETYALVADIETTLRGYDDEHRSAMSHLESTVRTALATVRNRKVTHDAFDRIKANVASIRDKLADTRHSLQYVESFLNVIQEEIALLEPDWEKRR